MPETLLLFLVYKLWFDDVLGNWKALPLFPFYIVKSFCVVSLLFLFSLFGFFWFSLNWPASWHSHSSLWWFRFPKSFMSPSSDGTKTWKHVCCHKRCCTQRIAARSWTMKGCGHRYPGCKPAVQGQCYFNLSLPSCWQPLLLGCMYTLQFCFSNYCLALL
jgi:hypothetical protein